MNVTASALPVSCAAGATGDVIPVEIAAAKAVAISKPITESEQLPLIEARGRVSSKGVESAIDLPPFDNSAMDGYAVCTGTLTGDGPWKLLLNGRVAAGETSPPNVPPDRAIRILTGAPVPNGFDAVVMQENCELLGQDVLFRKRPRRHENMRLAGEDVRSGTTILGAGQTITPQRLALLAGQGIAETAVVRKVRVGLVSTGSELCEPGVPLGPGQIYNSNRIMLSTMLSGASWAQVVDYGIVRDKLDDLVRIFSRASADCDVLVTTGGVSGGDEDHVMAAVTKSSGGLEVLKVAMRPGKPVKVGLLGGKPFFGLPGNPNAALVTFRQIALPAIRSIAGLSDVWPNWLAGVSGFHYEKRLGRTEFVPVEIVGRDELGLPVLEMLGRGSSASLSAIARADGIALLHPQVSTVTPGLGMRFEPFASC